MTSSKFRKKFQIFGISVIISGALYFGFNAYNEQQEDVNKEINNMIITLKTYNANPELYIKEMKRVKKNFKNNTKNKELEVEFDKLVTILTKMEEETNNIELYQIYMNLISVKEHTFTKIETIYEEPLGPKIIETKDVSEKIIWFNKIFSFIN